MVAGSAVSACPSVGVVSLIVGPADRQIIDVGDGAVGAENTSSSTPLPSL